MQTGLGLRLSVVERIETLRPCGDVCRLRVIDCDVCVACCVPSLRGAWVRGPVLIGLVPQCFCVCKVHQEVSALLFRILI
jgi:hypothetical protein